jgi:hypothetical protein
VAGVIGGMVRGEGAAVGEVVYLRAGGEG